LINQIYLEFTLVSKQYQHATLELGAWSLGLGEVLLGGWC